MKPVYLIGSPTELGNDIFLESRQVYLTLPPGVAVYASIDEPSSQLLNFLGSDTPVAKIFYDRPTEFADGVREEIENLLPKD
jgi:hypothetical protein